MPIYPPFSYLFPYSSLCLRYFAHINQVMGCGFVRQDSTLLFPMLFLSEFTAVSSIIIIVSSDTFIDMVAGIYFFGYPMHFPVISYSLIFLASFRRSCYAHFFYEFKCFFCTDIFAKAIALQKFLFSISGVFLSVTDIGGYHCTFSAFPADVYLSSAYLYPADL